jgi:hypothetical protein
MTKHWCDSDNPTRPCCWAVREREIRTDDLTAAAFRAAIEQRYGRTQCSDCLRSYEADATEYGIVALDHSCRSKRSTWEV